MTRLNICTRYSSAILRDLSQIRRAQPKRSLHATTPNQKIDSKRAPSLRRNERYKGIWSKVATKAFPPNSEPFSDHSVQLQIEELRSRDPRIIRDFTHIYAQVIDARNVPRAILLTILSFKAFSTVDRWQSDSLNVFEKHRHACGLSVGEVHEVARQLSRFTNERETHNTARMLLHCCSQSGYEEATLDLGISYQKHAAVNRRDYLQARDQVHRLAEEGNLRAASLEAELAESDNGSKVAIPLWERALNIARDQETVDRPGASRFSYLEKPWIRLAVLKFQTDHQGANAALRVGMVKDDPDAYYAFAKLNHDRRHDSKQFFLEWINAVTKSAAGGSFRSAIALADHYANEAATDLTEFLNAKETSHAWWPNWFERARVSHMSPANAEQDDRMTGLGARTSQYHSQVAAFASAARTPVDRMHMAIRWLRVATEQGLVEAILKLAVLHSRRFIFQAHNLEMKIKHPAEQTDIDINDYFGFEADLAEAEPTLSNTFAAPNDHVKEFVWRKGTVNPFYNPAMVASLLGDAFHCFAWINTTRNREQSAALSLANLKVAPRWYTFPDITALNEENSDRNLSQTMGIADELGVDLVYVDGEEKVVRKHTGVRGQGMWEFDHPKEEKARNVQFVE